MDFGQLNYHRVVPSGLGRGEIVPPPSYIGSAKPLDGTIFGKITIYFYAISRYASARFEPRPFVEVKVPDPLTR